MKKVNVAIDGPSGAGKSTVSKEISKRLGYTPINSGSLYRAIAFNVIQNGLDPYDVNSVINSLVPGMLKLQYDESVWLNGRNISHEIRADYVSQSAAVVAKIQEVRNFVVDYVQQMTKHEKGFIVDGRDTTFKLMPHAEVKIFLWADPEERANRRCIQNNELGYKTNFEEVLYEVKARDAQDMNREVDPLHKTEDAIEIDCTNMDFEEVVQTIINIINQKVSENA
ncbi:(d)CMP kinase [Mycoplasmopsis pullorum]|uniref:(d)CMP kinase n=1 Tax=Mycoplasmopsis pullorum TaxID=48003 RepID=UPI001118A40A|nr:(d)CMP kinase [Mycoplasmopsis pullorum]TNK83440.1 (d)CMP kinase [Mycoplasmopsis pullorum]TNK92121.1 (d)CMP kinase [Mycoplasmopsis pullorum]